MTPDRGGGRRREDARQVASAVADLGDRAEAVYRCVLHEYPVTATDVSRQLDIHLTTAIYHLHQLARRDLVFPREKHWFPARAREAARAWKPPIGPAGSRLLDLLEARGPLDQTTAARLMGVSKPAMSSLVGRLQMAGALRVERRGRRKILHAPARRAGDPDG